jgi:outer membrane immunogenic protein
MKKTNFATITLALTLSVGAAQAADLPSIKGPLPPPPPPPMWTGLYVGLSTGGTWANNNSMSIGGYPIGLGPLAPFGLPGLAAAVASVTANVPSSSSGGFIGGGQLGYNWRLHSNFVAGVEADIQGVAGNSSARSAFGAVIVPGFGPDAVLTSTSASTRLDYIGTVRGRLGYLVTPTLLAYGAGGLAYGGVTASTSIFQVDQGPTAGGVNAPYFGAGSFADTRAGWTAGGGVEWMFWPNWSAKVEYLYYDLGSVSFSSSPLIDVNLPPGAFAGTPFYILGANHTIRFNGNIVRAGVNYHFNWAAPAPVVAKY